MPLLEELSVNMPVYKSNSENLKPAIKQQIYKSACKV